MDKVLQHLASRSNKIEPPNCPRHAEFAAVHVESGELYSSGSDVDDVDAMMEGVEVAQAPTHYRPPGPIQGGAQTGTAEAATPPRHPPVRTPTG